MASTFKVGDHVRWNSEAGWVSGRIVRVHRLRYVHHPSEGDPQYEIKSDKTDHVAIHKGGATAASPLTAKSLLLPALESSKSDV